MSGVTPTKQENPLEQMFEEPIARPEGDDGIGPTLGMDVDKDDPSKARREARSFDSANPDVLKGARSH